MARRWVNCNRCHLSCTRRNVVLGHGDTPCDILVIGEAPTQAEDLRGKAFIGPDGRLVKELLATAENLSRVPMPRIYFTLAVACKPCDEKGGKSREPNGDELLACSQRLQWETDRAQPRRVIFLGSVVEKQCGKLFKGALRVAHPTVMRNTGGAQSSLFAKAARDISELFKEVADAV